MDVSPEEKGRVQSLDDISDEFDPINDADSNYGRVIGIKVASRTNPAIAEDMDVSPEEKGRVQSLDDISDEFDPINDADSNYGRVIGIKVASRTNPAIAEDMDVSPEEKAPEQMLYDLDGPQPTDPSYASLRKSAVRHAARGPNKQQKLRQMIQQGIIGTADKAPKQMLAQRASPVNVWKQIGAQEPSLAASKVMKQNDDTGYKARVQSLDDISDEFDPINDADSNYGRVIGIKVASRTNPAIAEDMDVSPEEKGRVQMLDDISDEFDPINDADSNYGRVIGIKVASRTNPAIAEDMDVSPEEKGRVQMLDDISDEFDPINDADSNYGRVIGIKVASRTNPAIAEDMDVSPEEKAPEQMLYDVDGPQPTDAKYSSWKQAAKYDQGMKKGKTLKDQILAAQPH